MTPEKKNGPDSEPTNQPAKQDITTKIDFDKVDAAEASAHRPLLGWIARLVSVLAIFAAVFHIVVLRFYPMDPWVFRTCHLVLLGVLG
ncbi:MAG: TRAP transporter permease, partial [Eubacteriales bacterium]|nr:TRAP transporter permease [Eubacteriales bacterium]